MSSVEQFLEMFRSRGWMVAVHNDYRLKGKPMTFWLLTHEKTGRYVKGEGKTDTEALEQCWAAREALKGNGDARAQAVDLPDQRPLFEPRRFDEFWKECPRKEGKGDARKAYAAKVKAGVSEEALIVGMRRYAASRKGQDEKFTKTPGPWINGERWLDVRAKSASPEETVKNLQPSDDQWRDIVRAWKLKGGSWWDPVHGPAPGKPGCRVPQHLLT